MDGRVERNAVTAKEQVVLVTGASSGIGKATAEYLAARGYRVFAGARRPDADATAKIPTAIHRQRLRKTYLSRGVHAETHGECKIAWGKIGAKNTSGYIAGDDTPA